MRVLDENGSELATVDLNKGRVTVERVLKQHHEAVAAVPEQGHWTPVGDGEAWIVEVPATRAYPAWDEYETVQRYHAYTAEELEARQGETVEKQAEELRTSQVPAALSLLLAPVAAALTDTQALQVSAFFPDWVEGGVYKLGTVARYGNALYRALQDSTGQKAQEPNVAVSLWKRIDAPDKNGVYPWSQPLGATDAYKKGDVVTHDGGTWVSTVDGNVWEPGVYGWSGQAEGSK